MTLRATSLSGRRAAWSLALSAAAFGVIAVQPAGAAVNRATVSGPSADLDILGNDRVDVDVAPDGSAAIAFRQKILGVDHAFVSRYIQGAWTPPQRVDNGLATPSTRPVVAVRNGGGTVVVFPNGTAGNEKLYAAVSESDTTPFTKVDLQLDPAGWKDVDLDLARGGNGYFTVYQGFNLRAWRIQGTTFTQVGQDFPGVGGILNAAPGEQAESGDQRGAHVAVDNSGDTATIAWTETSGLEYKPWARKLSGTAPAQIGAAVDASVATFDGKPAAGGFNDMSSVSVGGDGRAWVTFRAGFVYGGSNIGRGLVRSFDGTSFGAPQVIDGLPATPTESAEFPRLATNTPGGGLAASYRQLTFGTEAATLAPGGSWTPGQVVSEGTNVSAGRASVALADSGVGLVSMYSETTAGQAKVLGRISGGPAAGTLETLSDPAFGPSGIAAETGASATYAVTAFRQGSGATSRIVAAVVPLPVPAPPSPQPPVTPEAPTTDPKPTPTAPKLTNLKLRKKTITATGAAPKVVSATAKQRTLSFSLDRAASVEISVKRLKAGKRSGTSCVSAKGRTVAKKQRCTYEVAVPGTTTLRFGAGTTHLQFGGRTTAGRRLAAGSYALYAVARDDQATGAAVRAPFSLRR